ncbi:maleylacetoacetate isomerase [Roseateles asaccharophilus]|uniref:Maleylacetoacetate isomerase/maleylpyruvate isomerase n=1 Tax=Roseateles asaccharophilus TaxID=582607 RepID=A0ABU2A422_9BURK|nr:maleylacetoacetate isomerase [Roseateles asaccharophilus]MDR7331378.1 maleylacetoacetate isomerase/maleylpyruvate isomerase [Roseateles asaccharophilus]
MKLYNYFRSSASWRVRIALALKGLSADYVSVHLQKNEQFAGSFAQQQVSHLVPALELDDGTWLSQSLAILEYLDETHPEPPLLPRDALGRARVRALAMDIACDIHPINNLRVLRYLKSNMGHEQAQIDAWYRHWVATGLAIVEQRLAQTASAFCFGDTPGLADCLLVPQVYNAQRFECPLDAYPTVLRINAACLALPAFANTRPEACPDAG